MTKRILFPDFNALVGQLQASRPRRLMVGSMSDSRSTVCNSSELLNYQSQKLPANQSDISPINY